MPYSNYIGVTPNCLASVAAYLVNERHEHHEDYKLTPIQVLGAQSVPDFIARAKGTFLKNSRKGTGRPPKNAANWIIVRMPDEAHLSELEMATYETAVREETGMGASIIGILNWHKNKYTGAADLNLLSASFDSRGRLIRDVDSDPVGNLRWRMDQITDDLNAIRRSRGIHPIVTMPEVKRERALQRGEADLVEELARLPMPPSTTDKLEPALLSLGCSITRINWDLDTISVRMPERKKAKKFRILKLLFDVTQMVLNFRRRSDGLEVPPSPPPSPIFKPRHSQEPTMPPP